MKKTKPQKNSVDYKVVISDLGVSPFFIMRTAFALMCIIPILAFFYIMIGKNFLHRIFLGSGGLIAVVAICLSMAGFLYAYKLVQDMTKKLLAYSFERKRADEEKTELLMAVSHDLKTPLTVIKAGMDNLLKGIGGALNKGNTGIAETCLISANKLTNFIDELLSFSEAGFVRTNFKREFFDFGKIVKEEIREISQLAKRSEQHLRSKFLSKEFKLWGDEKKISRVVMNLLSNAIKYTPKGGKIDVVLSEEKDAVKFVVINTGPGIQPDEMKTIFDKYERLKKHKEIEGTGLGLAIVKEIVDIHRGQVAVKSQADKETEFSVVLPKDIRAREQAKV